MREGDLYKPMIDGAAAEGWTLFHPQEGAQKAPFDLCGIVKRQPYIIQSIGRGGSSYVTMDEAYIRSQENGVQVPVDPSFCFGQAVAIEVKKVDGPWSPTATVPWSALLTHQVWWLKCYAGAGGLALVAIWYDSAKKMNMHLVRHDGTEHPLVHVMEMAKRPDGQVLTGWDGILPLWGHYH